MIMIGAIIEGYMRSPELTFTSTTAEKERVVNYKQIKKASYKITRAR